MTWPAAIRSPSLDASHTHFYTHTDTHQHHTHLCSGYFPHPCLLVFLGNPLAVSCGVSPVEECMFCLWSVTCTSTVGLKWMWALSQEISTDCVSVCVWGGLVDWWGDTSTDGGFRSDECHGWASSCPLGSASRKASPPLSKLSPSSPSATPTSPFVSSETHTDITRVLKGNQCYKSHVNTCYVLWFYQLN